MENQYCFVAVEFIYDINVIGNVYWYECAFKNVKVGDKVIAPLGRHNNEQTGVVRKVLFADEANAPYPFEVIKRIKKIVPDGLF